MKSFQELISTATAPRPQYDDNGTRYPNFEIVRLFLALIVTYDHARYYYDPSSSWYGWLSAVPAFLAISGFLVLQSYAQSKSWIHFMKKRALRLFPALILSFVLCFALFDWPTTFNSILNWLTGGLYTIEGVGGNGPLWSLAWEEIAYLMLAVLWMFGAYRRPIYIWLLLILSIAIVWWSWAVSIDGHTRVILFLLPSFFIGNLMYLHRGSLLATPSLIPWIFLYGVIQYRLLPQSQYLGDVPLICAQAYAVVWVSIAGMRLIPVKIPDISYGIYIYHLLFIMWLKTHVEMNSLFDMVCYLGLLVIPFSLFSWYMVEKPALRFKGTRVALTSVPVE